MRKLRESLLKMACRLACFACFVLPVAAEPQLTLNPVKMPQGGGSLVCKNVAYGPLK